MCKYETFLKSRPDEMERKAIESIVSFAENSPGCHLHVVHLSSADPLGTLQRARDRVGYDHVDVQ